MKSQLFNLVPPSVRKIEFEKSKSGLFHFREYVSTTLLQGLQPPTKVFSILQLFLRTLGSALLSLTILATNAFSGLLCLLETFVFLVLILIAFP